MTDALNYAPPINGSLSESLPPSSIPVASNGVNGIHVASNGTSHPNIALDQLQQESDVRHEPVPIPQKPELKETTSMLVEVGTPVDPASLPFTAPHGTPPPPQGELLQDVKMAESQPSVQGMNGDRTPSQDVQMGEPDQSTTIVPLASSASTLASNGPPPLSFTPSTIHEPPTANGNDEDMEPPTKRARKHSDAEQASNHFATPPPASASPSIVPDPTPTEPAPPSSDLGGGNNINSVQYRFCLGIIRSLRKMKEAIPFLRPVDPIALNIPHYPDVIKHPMDLSTVERKLNSSNPAKPDPNPSNPRYHTTDQFVADVRLIFSNCVLFNGPEHLVSHQGKRVEEQFDKQLKMMPPAEVKSKAPPVHKKVSPAPNLSAPVPAAAVVKKMQPPRRTSTSTPVIRRNEAEINGRPKREIHAPPSKELPYSDLPKKARKLKRAKGDGTPEQFKYCSKILQDLHKKQYYQIASPFYEPVDWVKMQLPEYPKVVKKPMDLSTIRHKLDNQEYSTPMKFHDDFKLMIRNCFAFNPAGTPVNQAGIELQRLFDDKWRGLPVPRPEDDEDEEDEDDEAEEERARTIAEMESQIEAMKNNIDALRSQPAKKEKKPVKPKRDKVPVASTSKPPPAKPTKPTGTKKKSSKKQPVTDDDVLSFEQKKDLSEAITRLDGAKLERVIQIIHEGVPDLKNSSDEIELEVDLLPATVLIKLYNFVLRPMRAPPTKRSRTGKGTGTGGLKRKSMDEDVEAEKIRQLEERMALFEQGSVPAPGPSRRADVSDHSSDSSSDDSSGSESE